jgi:Multiubiquitin
MSNDDNQGKKPDKSYEIVVDGTPHTVEDDTVTYEQVVAIAYPTPPNADTKFTVTFYKAHDPKEGTLKPGGSVEVKKHGTVFNVKATIKS